MKVVVFCKSVPDTETRVRLKDSRLDKSEIKYILNPARPVGVLGLSCPRPCGSRLRSLKWFLTILSNLLPSA